MVGVIKKALIVMAEDDPDDRLLTMEAVDDIDFPIELIFVEDGEELINYLEHHERYINLAPNSKPDLILLDLNMPRKDGREALLEIKSRTHLRKIPVVILTTSRSEEDVHFCYQNGASGYITKPARYDELIAVMQTICNYWFKTVKLPNRFSKVVE